MSILLRVVHRSNASRFAPIPVARPKGFTTVRRAENEAQPLRRMEAEEEEAQPLRRMGDEDEAAPLQRMEEEEAQPLRRMEEDEEASPLRRIEDEEVQPVRRNEEDDDVAPLRRAESEDEAAPLRRMEEEEEAQPLRRVEEEDVAPLGRLEEEEAAAPLRRTEKEEVGPLRRMEEEEAQPLRRVEEDEARPTRRLPSPNAETLDAENSPPPLENSGEPDSQYMQAIRRDASALGQGVPVAVEPAARPTQSSAIVDNSSAIPVPMEFEQLGQFAPEAVPEAIDAPFHYSIPEPVVSAQNTDQAKVVIEQVDVVIHEPASTSSRPANALSGFSTIARTKYLGGL